MKRCPTCQRTFTDPNLSFCIEDGTPLSLVDAGDEVTNVSPREDEFTQWAPASYRPPSINQPERPRKSSWPWVLGIGGVAVLLLAAFGIGAFVYIPKMMKERRERAAAPQERATPNTSQDQNAPAATPQTEETIKTPPPTSEELVLAQLTQLENEWEVANINADKKQLELILADDFVAPVSEQSDRTIGKDEYLNSIRRDTETEKWNFRDLVLTLRGDRATLSGKVERTTQGKVELSTFTDKFVWRNGRWQATGSVVVRATDS